MKILYGVQGTGNGHISRANAMLKAFEKYKNLDVTWLLSGRAQNALFAADDVMWRRGLTFECRDGGVQYLETLKSNNVFKLVRDVRRLDLSSFGRIVTDYEPVVAWAAKLRGRSCVGIGHQYAFNDDVPLAGANVFNRGLMKHFAPVSQGLGLHWHLFNRPIMPPICDLDDMVRGPVISDKVLVYLPFDNQSRLINVLRGIVDIEFTIYSPELLDGDVGNIHTRALSREGFRQDLLSCNGVITGSGFELISECLKLGIRILTKPLAGQVEQLSNAEALRQLDYATVIDGFNEQLVGDWLANKRGVQISYPAVHETLAEWLLSDQKVTLEQLSEGLWAEVKVHRFDADDKITYNLRAQMDCLTALPLVPWTVPLTMPCSKARVSNSASQRSNNSPF